MVTGRDKQEETKWVVIKILGEVFSLWFLWILFMRQIMQLMVKSISAYIKNYFKSVPSEK